MTHDLDEVEAFLGLISYEDWLAQGEAPPGSNRHPWCAQASPDLRKRQTDRAFDLGPVEDRPS